MSDKDEIKELFQKELGNYEAKVDPGLWQGIQSGISAGTSSAAMSVGAKIAIGVISSAVVTAVSVFIYNASIKESTTNQPITGNQIKVEESLKQNNPVVLNEKDERNKGEVTDNNTIESEDENQRSLKNSLESETEQPGINEPLIKETDHKSEETAKVEDTNKPHESEESKTALSKEDKTTEKEPKEVLVPLVFEPVIAKQENQYVVFDIQETNVDEVVWNFGDGEFSRNSKPEHFYKEDGTYQVEVIGRKGDREINKTLEVNVHIEGEIVKLPNIFSPNNDRQSDLFFIESKGIEEFQITIMDKDQKVVFKSNDVNFKWDGSLSTGAPAPAGDYIYIIVAKDKQGNTINKYQRLTLQR